MEVAPFRALTRTTIASKMIGIDFVEMEVAPFRALTHDPFSRCNQFRRDVEMEVAPFRALTPKNGIIFLYCL